MMQISLSDPVNRTRQGQTQVKIKKLQESANTIEKYTLNENELK